MHTVPLNIMQETLHPLLTSGRDVIIYGAGYNGIDTLIQLRKHGITPSCFCDADAGKHGLDICGVDVIGSNELESLNKNSAIIVTPQECTIDIVTMLSNKRFNNILFHSSAWAMLKQAEETIKRIPLNQELYKRNEQKVKLVFEHLCDQKSRDVFDAAVKYHLTGDYHQGARLRDGDLYYPKGVINIGENEVYVDCGAYNGETIAHFISKTPDGSYRYIYGFEPDPMVFQMLNAYVSKRRWKDVRVEEVGISAERGKLHFIASGDISSHITIEDDDSVEITVSSLDNLLHAPNCPHPPTYIKMDIEGAELDALRGATQTIQTFHPKLAVCLYHRFEDLWEIPYYILSNYQNYSIYIRQHAEALEQVLYAV